MLPACHDGFRLQIVRIIVCEMLRVSAGLGSTHKRGAQCYVMTMILEDPKIGQAVRYSNRDTLRNLLTNAFFQLNFFHYTVIGAIFETYIIDRALYIYKGNVLDMLH